VFSRTNVWRRPEARTCSSACQWSLVNVKVASGKAPMIGARLSGNRIDPKLGPCDESVIRNKEAVPRPLCVTHYARSWSFLVIFRTVSLGTSLNLCQRLSWEKVASNVLASTIYCGS
jgi:hypothetical protein